MSSKQFQKSFVILHNIFLGPNTFYFTFRNNKDYKNRVKPTATLRVELRLNAWGLNSTVSYIFIAWCLRPIELYFKYKSYLYNNVHDFWYVV
jgi:hypothetical protein